MHWLASVDPGNDAEPAAHGRQAEAPCRYVLPGHWEVQLADPLGDTVPAVQGWQLADPAGDAVPAGQGWQLTDPPGDAAPAGHSWQPLAPHVEGSLPAGQLPLAPVQPAPHAMVIWIGWPLSSNISHVTGAIGNNTVELPQQPASG